MWGSELVEVWPGLDLDLEAEILAKALKAGVRRVLDLTGCEGDDPPVRKLSVRHARESSPISALPSQFAPDRFDIRASWEG